jgi:hypothetical protein
MIKAILKPFKFIFKAVKFVVMLPINLVKFILIKVWAVIKYVLNLVWKILKGIYKGIIGVINEGTQVITWIITSIWNAIKWVFINTWKLIVWVFEKAGKLVKFIWAWLVEAFVETLNQLWTLLGMFAAWLVLEGSAKTIVGYAIITVLFVWLITIRIREGE